jgi:hypothetical protein
VHQVLEASERHEGKHAALQWALQHAKARKNKHIVQQALLVSVPTIHWMQAQPVTVVGCRPDCDKLIVEHPFISVHDQLMSPSDELNAVGLQQQGEEWMLSRKALRAGLGQVLAAEAWCHASGMVVLCSVLRASFFYGMCRQVTAQINMRFDTWSWTSRSFSSGPLQVFKATFTAQTLP